MAGTSDKQIDPQMEVQFLKGVGPARAQAFSKLGVEKAADLLEYYPRNWEFAPEIIKIRDITPNVQVTIGGVIESIDFIAHRRPKRLEVYLADETGMCRVIWFNGGYLLKQLEVGMSMIAWGKVGVYKNHLQLTNPKFRIVGNIPQTGDELGGAIYPASGDLSTGQISKIIKPVISELADGVDEFFDKTYLRERNLIARKDAFKMIHLAKDDEQVRQAKRRLKYNEFFLMQAALAVRRYKVQHFLKADAMKTSDEIDSRIRRRFPFLLTEDQDNVINEIVEDMGRDRPMNRLLQGDVGSGKTVVALYAALLAIANKGQVAIMAPTEILANQHFISIERFLKNSKVKRAVITGGLNGEKRKQLLEKIENGEIDIVVGTVALLQQDIKFKNLSLVVIDEQHKFGVGQRATLRKDHSPHCLVMTATPIPRTLAMTAFGDLDVSIIKHKPPGRGKVITRRADKQHREAAFDFIRERLKAGRQAFFVYPRISNIEDDDRIKAAVDEYDQLSKIHFKDFKVGLLHGQMKSKDKEQAMEDFRRGRLNVLVSTVVIEVGVDVPNATIMVIEGADRFGLAQLHQLRGRIGRGQSQSYCFLFSETENEVAMDRLEVMVRSNDGFEIAEQDLRLRGPGEMFSTRQHGLPDLKIANIIDDFELLAMTRRDAFKVIESDPMLKNPGNRNIRNELIKKFEGKIDLVDVG